MKKTKIIILIVLGMIITACAIGAVLYFTTDLFKTNQQLFYKYAMQMDLGDIIDEEFYNEYLEKQENTKYMKDSSLKVNIYQNGMPLLSNLQITTNGRNDIAQKLYQNGINIKYNEKEIISGKYVKNGDLYGVIINDVLNRYIVLENKNLKEFAQKVGFENVGMIPDKINFDSLNSSQITEEQAKELYNKYKNVILEQISKDNFSKLKKQKVEVDGKNLEAVGYKLTLSVKDIINICNKIMETLKNDKTIYNIIVDTEVINDMSFEDYQESIQNTIDTLQQEMQQEESNNVNNKDSLSISVYQKNNNLIKIETKILSNTMQKSNISLEITNNKKIITIKSEKTALYELTNEEKQISNSTIKIVKTNNSNGTVWDIFIDMEKNETTYPTQTINITRTGNIKDNNVVHNITYQMAEEGIEITAELNIKTNFVTSLDIQELDDKTNSIIINNIPKEQLEDFFTQLGEKIVQKMEESELNLLLSTMNTAQRIDFEGSLEEESTEMLKEMFNVRFSSYYGERRGTEIKSLINTVINSNQLNSEHQISINGKLLDSDLEKLIENIDNLSTYNVTFEYAEDGYITQITY